MPLILTSTTTTTTTRYYYSIRAGSIVPTTAAHALAHAPISPSPAPSHQSAHCQQPFSSSPSLGTASFATLFPLLFSNRKTQTILSSRTCLAEKAEAQDTLDFGILFLFSFFFPFSYCLLSIAHSSLSNNRSYLRAVGHNTPPTQKPTCPALTPPITRPPRARFPSMSASSMIFRTSSEKAPMVSFGELLSLPRVLTHSLTLSRWARSREGERESVRE